MGEEKKRLALQNQSEASLLDALLQQDDVPHFVHSFHDRAYDTLWQFQFGWGYVETPARYAGGVEALLELIRHNRLSEQPHQEETP